jgi:uncharacterized protein YceH (UPF0502 family)
MKLVELTPLEARIIGSLIEKQITTPDQYPLSLNSLVAACNQKSNRDPVMELDESTVRGALDGLIRKHLVIEKSGFGSRVPKFQHRFCNTEFGTLKFTAQEIAIVCELLLRGPQTPGELRNRASRMAAFGDSGAVESVLESLATRQDGPIVARLAREPGRRESRYAQLFTGRPPVSAGDSEAEHGSLAPPSQPAQLLPADTALAALQQRVERLEAELQALKDRLAATQDAQSPADR